MGIRVGLNSTRTPPISRKHLRVDSSFSEFVKPVMFFSASVPFYLLTYCLYVLFGCCCSFTATGWWVGSGGHFVKNFCSLHQGQVNTVIKESNSSKGKQYFHHQYTPIV
jgi:hypothetical protein